MITAPFRHTIQLVMKVVYGMNIDSEKDHYIKLAEEVIQLTSDATLPETAVFDMLPIRTLTYSTHMNLCRTDLSMDSEIYSVWMAKRTCCPKF